MGARQGHADLVVEELVRDEEVHVLLAPAHVGALVGEGHGEVALACLEGRQGLRGLGLGERDVDVGEALLDQGERAGDQRRRARRERHQAHPPGAQPRDRGDLLLRGIERGEDADGVARQDLAGLGEADVATDAFDEHGAGALLEAADHLRDRGLGVAEGKGGSGEASLVGDGLHDPEAGSVNHELSITGGYPILSLTRKS